MTFNNSVKYLQTTLSKKKHKATSWYIINVVLLMFNHKQYSSYALRTISSIDRFCEHRR